MRIPALPGRILIQGIMVREAGLRSKTRNVAQWELLGAVLTPTSIQETLSEVVASQLTIPTRAWLPLAARDTPAIFIPDRESPAEVVLPTIRIRVRESGRAATTCTRARMEAFIATTDKIAMDRDIDAIGAGFGGGDFVFVDVDILIDTRHLHALR